MTWPVFVTRARLCLSGGREVLIDVPYPVVAGLVSECWRDGSTLCLPVEGKLFEPFRPKEVLGVVEVRERVAPVVDLPVPVRLAVAA